MVKHKGMTVEDAIVTLETIRCGVSFGTLRRRLRGKQKSAGS